MNLEAETDHESVQPRPTAFVIIGPEGSGKTTQARLLSGKLNRPLIVVSDLLRERARDDPGEIGQACRDVFANHTYLDPSLVGRIVTDRLSQDDTSGGFVLDGGNRTVEETEHFPQTLESANRQEMKIVILSLRLSGWESMERLIGRGREDDTVEGALSRLGRFYNRLGERASVMRRNWEFIQVDARGSDEDNKEKSMQEVNERIIKRLEIL